jgi:hypothetical protein
LLLSIAARGLVAQQRQVPLQLQREFPFVQGLYAFVCSVTPLSGLYLNVIFIEYKPTFIKMEEYCHLVKL